MPDLAQTCDVAINLHVVGWIGEHEVRALIPHDHVKVLAVPRIPAQQSVPPELPQIAKAGNLWPGNVRS